LRRLTLVARTTHGEFSVRNGIDAVVRVAFRAKVLRRRTEMAARAAGKFERLHTTHARRTCAALVALFACTLGARNARAENAAIEAAANKALDAARKDFTAKDFDAALETLNKALAACGEDACTPGTKAAILRDVGTMQYRKGDAADAEQSFVEALKLE